MLNLDEDGSSTPNTSIIKLGKHNYKITSRLLKKFLYKKKYLFVSIIFC